MARSGRFPHLHTSPFFLMASMRWSISMAIFQKIAIFFFTVTYRIIHVTVMSHSRDDYGKRRIKTSKMVFLICIRRHFF
jgi:hypothetical protein